MYEAAVERREGINKTVQTDVQQIFKVIVLFRALVKEHCLRYGFKYRPMTLQRPNRECNILPCTFQTCR